MDIIPKSFAGKIVRGLWLAACVAVLVFAYVQREIHDVGIAFMWFMIFLSFPIGFIITAVIGVLTFTMMDIYGPDATLPGGFIGNLIVWPVFVAAGYFQWFIFPSWVSKMWEEW